MRHGQGTCVRCDETTAPRSRGLKSCSDVHGGIDAGESGGGEPPRRLSGGTCSGCCTEPCAVWRRQRRRRCPHGAETRNGGSADNGERRGRHRRCADRFRRTWRSRRQSCEARCRGRRAQRRRERGAKRPRGRRRRATKVRSQNEPRRHRPLPGTTTRPVEAVRATRRSAAPGCRGCVPCRRGSR